MKSMFKRTLSLNKRPQQVQLQPRQVPAQDPNLLTVSGPHIQITDATPDEAMFPIEDFEVLGRAAQQQKRDSEVPLWTAKDVAAWVTKLGFPKSVAEAVEDTEVDGDLLLQLDERNLKEDLHVNNGIHRKRFLRELNNLKKEACYDCKDEHDVSGFLTRSLGNDYKVFAYNLIKSDLSPAYMRRLSEPDLMDMLKEAGVESTIHRRKIIEAVYDSTDDIDDDQGGSPNSGSTACCCDHNIDVYISFDKAKSGELASLIKMQLQMRGMSVCTADDIKGHPKALRHVRDAKSFVIVLTSSVLDMCIGDEASKCLLHREIVAALESDCNVVPVIDNFQFPDPDELPEDMRALCYFNAVRWVHDYQDACVDKIERFIRGEVLFRSDSSIRLNVSSSLINVPVAVRTSSGRSTPTQNQLLPHHHHHPAAGRRLSGGGGGTKKSAGGVGGRGTLERRKTLSVESGMNNLQHLQKQVAMVASGGGGGKGSMVGL